MKKIYLLSLSLFFIQYATAGTYQEVVSILETNCTFSSCHDADNPIADLDFTASAGSIYNQLIDAVPQNTAAASAGLKMVEPGYPQRSYLFQKINYGLHADSELDASMGGGMPTGGNAMAPEDIEMVRQWIYHGAKSNNDTDIAVSTIDNYYNGDGLDPIAPLAPPAAGEGFQLHFGQIFLDPLEEKELIYRYDLNNDEPMEITRIEVAMNTESHHFLFFNFDEGDEDNQDQGILPVTFLSSVTGQAVAITNDTKMIGGWAYPGGYELPQGTAFKWPSDAVLKFNYHILNYSSTGVLPAEIYVNIYTQPEGTALKEMYSDFFLDNPANLNIPTGEHTFEWTQNFSGSDSIHVWTLGSHTHALGTDFDIYKYNNQTGIGDQIYEGFYNFDYTVNQGFYDYAEPAFRTFDDYVSLGPPDGLHMIADYNNTTGSTVGFGLTTEDEMFGIFMQYLVGDISQLPGEEPEDTTQVNVLEESLISWNVKPNPAQDFVQITTPEIASISIYDAIGKVVMNDIDVNDILNLDTSEWKDGVYFIRMKSGESIETKKLVISH